jgi:hypothetical protein
MKLTTKRLKQVIREELKNERLGDLVKKVKGAFAPTEEKSLLEKVKDALQADHNIHLNDRHPLSWILQSASQENLEALLSRLDQPLGAGVKSFTASRNEESEVNEMLDPESMSVIQGFMQIIDNLGAAAYPAILGLAAMAGKEVVDAVKQKMNEKDPRGLVKNPEYRAK